MGKYTDEYLSMMKEYENPVAIGPTLGEVIEGFPNIRISILNGGGVLVKDELWIADYLHPGYSLSAQQNGQIQLQQNLSTESAGEHVHTHQVNMIVDTDYQGSGSIVFGSELKKGDKVMVVPTDDEQLWFVPCRVK